METVQHKQALRLRSNREALEPDSKALPVVKPLTLNEGSMNYKKILTIIEHIVLISLLAGSIGFYLGNQYGKSQVNVKDVTQALHTSK